MARHQKTYYVTVNHGDVGASGAELDVNSIKLKNSVLNLTDILEKKITKASDGCNGDPAYGECRCGYLEDVSQCQLSYEATSTPSLDGKTMMDFSDWKTFTVTSGDETVQNVYRIKVVSKAQAEITSFRVQAGDEWYNGTIDNAKSTIYCHRCGRFQADQHQAGHGHRIYRQDLFSDLRYCSGLCQCSHVYAGRRQQFGKPHLHRYCAEQKWSADLCKEQRRRR